MEPIEELEKMYQNLASSGIPTNHIIILCDECNKVFTITPDTDNEICEHLIKQLKG